MSDNRPVWLVDVDGVINVPKPGWGSAPRSGRAWSGNTEWTIRWAPQLVERIRTMHTSGSVEVRWCTTWCPDADQLERLFRLPRLERAWTSHQKGLAADLAKLAAAREVLASGRRLIWTDDEVVPTSGPIYDELVAEGRALLIAPSPRRGLQLSHLEAIDAFINGHLVPPEDSRHEALMDDACWQLSDFSER